MKVAIDTNVLAYAEGVNSKEQKDAALMLLRRLPRDRIVLPVQVLGELFNVLVRKAGLSRSASQTVVMNWASSVALIGTSPAVITNATDLARDHHLSIWDAVILAAAAHAGCRFLLSEDMQEGFTWQGVAVANPFSSRMDPILSASLSG